LQKFSTLVKRLNILFKTANFCAEALRILHIETSLKYLQIPRFWFKLQKRNLCLKGHISLKKGNAQKHTVSKKGCLQPAARKCWQEGGQKSAKNLAFDAAL